MGLPLDYFEGDISGGYVTLDINQYPACPNPTITLGLPPHCGRDLIAILLPGQVPGLEVAYKGHWIKVQPVPLAFVVNFGQQLEVVTPELLIAAAWCSHHRAPRVRQGRVSPRRASRLPRRGSARTARCQWPRKRPGSLTGEPAVEWSPLGGGGALPRRVPRGGRERALRAVPVASWAPALAAR